ncbi:hypothetical protein BW247_10175 [Acidihalobacter ferrooxydans]|uniref:OmpR/PhoB-type domain-containing protein n=2 Tax=Acidihalobacter ferrooxydans TaxID=1765967 RepID=A0A1P8UHT9_9GAMM|nr:hypothetical protein BW247_10175 [Acidihalobacter ferrooxydans]
MKIRVLGDDAAACAALSRSLERCGARLIHADGAAPATAIVVCVDDPTAAPGVLRELRARCAMAALLVLTSADLNLRVRMLEAGADDLLPPTTPPEEIIARLSALADLAPEAGPWLDVGKLRLGPSRVAVYLEERHLDLGEEAYRVLRCLAEATPNAVTRDALMNAGWGEPVMDNRLEALIRRLRKALARAPSPRIETFRGLGYRLRDTSEKSRLDC